MYVYIYIYIYIYICIYIYMYIYIYIFFFFFFFFFFFSIKIISNSIGKELGHLPHYLQPTIDLRKKLESILIKEWHVMFHFNVQLAIVSNIIKNAFPLNRNFFILFLSNHLFLF